MFLCHRFSPHHNDLEPPGGCDYCSFIHSFTHRYYGTNPSSHQVGSRLHPRNNPVHCWVTWSRDKPFTIHTHIHTNDQFKVKNSFLKPLLSFLFGKIKNCHWWTKRKARSRGGFQSVSGRFTVTTRDLSQVKSNPLPAAIMGLETLKT